MTRLSMRAPRRLAAVLAVLAGLLFAIAPITAFAAQTGIAYLPPSVTADATLEVPILEDYLVQAPASTTDANGNTVPGVATVDLTQYMPQGITPDAIRVVITNATGDATLKALDSAGTVLATASIVPLSSGFEVTLPGATAQLQIENLATQVWEGTITVIVESAIKIELNFIDRQITITNGYGEAAAEVVVYQAPDGYVRLLSYDPNPSDSIPIIQLFKVEFKGNYGRVDVQAHSDPANPVRIPATVAITTSADAGTYDVGVKMYFFNATTQAEVEVGDFSITVALQGDASGTATADAQQQAAEEEGDSRVTYAAAGVAAAFLVILLAAAITMVRNR